MPSEPISNMTLDDLKAIVNATVDQRIQELLKPQDPRSVKEINATIRKLRWTPPADSPSNLDLLREDRDR